MNILVVDDEILIRSVIKEYLLLNSFNVIEAENGKEAIDVMGGSKIDLIIMDVMMPKVDGFSAVREIRKNYSTPVIMLSARGEEFDKLTGFELGIDDYVTKPFSPKELIARVNAILKRNKVVTELIEINGIKIDELAHEVYIDNKEISLTPKEYDLLKYLIMNKNIALSREQLLSNVWGYDFFGDDRTIDTHVKTLRNHLGKYRNYIKTVREVGYKFEYKE